MTPKENLETWEHQGQFSVNQKQGSIQGNPKDVMLLWPNSTEIAQATPLVLSVSGATGRKPGRPCGVRNRNHAEHTPGLRPT